MFLWAGFKKSQKGKKVASEQKQREKEKKADAENGKGKEEDNEDEEERMDEEQEEEEDEEEVENWWSVTCQYSLLSVVGHSPVMNGNNHYYDLIGSSKWVRKSPDSSERTGRSECGFSVCSSFFFLNIMCLRYREAKELPKLAFEMVSMMGALTMQPKEAKNWPLLLAQWKRTKSLLYNCLNLQSSWIKWFVTLAYSSGNLLKAQAGSSVRDLCWYLHEGWITASATFCTDQGKQNQIGN